jgi:hypothetical protein
MKGKWEKDKWEKDKWEKDKASLCLFPKARIRLLNSLTPYRRF